VQEGERFLAFTAPLATLEARDPGSVLTMLREADSALADGRFVAGFVAYEAAAAFGLATLPPDPEGPPLVWLGVFDAPRETPWPRAPDAAPPEVTWRPALDATSHAARLARLHERIAAGDTYQVNFTFPLEAPLEEEPAALFARLVAAQRPRHAAYVDLGRFAIVSASPELFFERESGLLRTRPMKGTAARGATAEQDDALAAALSRSEKERAENLMVVDMLRNDLGRVAELGSVETASLFDVERYPTLLQMTSSVTARSQAPLSALFEALFPCASVTGAPKKRTMEIVAATEVAPRGVYTGAIGWAGPDGRAHWNVAIRTVVADRDRGFLRFGTGSGVVADSRAASEYEECLLKARILHEPPFALLETFALLPGEGYRQLDGHLARLAGSARHFGFPLDMRRIEEALRRTAGGVVGAARVRLTLHADGRTEVEATALPQAPARTLQIGLAARPVDPRSIWLFHKTTRRDVYDEAAASRPDCDDVLLWNDRGELTESTVASVVVEIGGQRLTPPVSCGLLPGVERQVALAEGRAREGVVRISDLAPGQRLWLLSSLRGSREARLVG
jgi:para-aminobenzoate synthetase/4-amino-4-deoxychorismate lyase